MPTECSAELFDFAPVEGRMVVAAFDGGTITSDAGALLSGRDRPGDRIWWSALRRAFAIMRRQELIEHEVATLVGQRVFGIALGYEDLNDHDELRHDPVMAVLAGKLAARRRGLRAGGRQVDAQPAGAEPAGADALSQDQPRRGGDRGAVRRAVPGGARASRRSRSSSISMPPTIRCTAQQEGRFFHGYYDCYCYLPLYVFCGRHLLAAKLRRAEHRRRGRRGRGGGAHRRARSAPAGRGCGSCCAPTSGFAREDADGLVRGTTACDLPVRAGPQRAAGRRDRRASLPRREPQSRAHRPAGAPLQGLPGGATRDSWSRQRRVVAKAEWTQGEANPRFVVTSLKRSRGERAAPLRGDLLRPRRHGEPHQGVPARPVRRPHLGRHHARQPAAAVVRLDGLCAALRPAPHRPCRHRSSPTPPAAPSASSS